MTMALIKKDIWSVSGIFLALSITVGWVVYALFGHYLIDTLYRNESIDVIDKIMAGRADTPLQYYYQEADRVMVVGTFGALFRSFF